MCVIHSIHSHTRRQLVCATASVLFGLEFIHALLSWFSFVLRHHAFVTVPVVTVWFLDFNAYSSERAGDRASCHNLAISFCLWECDMNLPRKLCKHIDRLLGLLCTQLKTTATFFYAFVFFLYFFSSVCLSLFTILQPILSPFALRLQELHVQKFCFSASHSFNRCLLVCLVR